jgi:pimeloyl-ACP methyl ester carboxylesterase
VETILSDGRTLGYAEYGKSDGTPVFFFHGIPGSRIFRPPDDVTIKLGVRLITADRPGYGLSAFQPERKILDWADDIAQLADHLDITKFSIAGHSGGGPYVAAVAYALPERVKAAALLSSVGPIQAPHATDGMQLTNKMGFHVGRWMPFPLWRVLFYIFFSKGREHPEKVLVTVSDPANPDAAMFALPGARDMMMESTREAFRQGTLGHAWEARLLCRPWGFELGGIRFPTFLWHGTADIDAPISMGQTLARQIPDCRVTFCDGEAHLLLLKHWEEILSTLTSEHP